MKFNLSKFSASGRNVMVKEASVKNIVSRFIEPTTGKTYGSLFSQSMPGETPEARRSRIQPYINSFEEILKNPFINAVLSMQVVENEIKSKIGEAAKAPKAGDAEKAGDATKADAGIKGIEGLRQIFKAMLIDKFLPAFKEAAVGAMSEVGENDKAEGMRLIEEWYQGMPRLIGQSDFNEKMIYFISNFIRLLKSKNKLLLRGNLSFDLGKFEAMLHGSGLDDISVKGYQGAGVEDLSSVTQNQSQVNEGKCGFKGTSASKWYMIYGSSQAPECLAANTELWQKYSPPSWCTSRGSAGNYLQGNSKVYLLNFGGKETLSRCACVVNNAGSIKEVVDEYNQPPFQYFSYIKDLVEKENIKFDNASQFGWHGGIKVPQAFEWVNKNANMSDETFMKHMDKRIDTLLSVVKKHNNIIELAADTSEKENTGDIDYMGSKALFADKFKKPEVRDGIINMIRNKSSKLAFSKQIIKIAQLQGSMAEVAIEYILYSLGMPSVGDTSAIGKNLRSLLNNKSLPTEEEDLLFKDDQPETLKQIIDHMVYQKI